MGKVHKRPQKIARQRMKTDRRTQKTKKFLAEALMALIIEKGYDAVTIQDIIDRANVGRSTFYSHYESKDQLLIGNINFQDELINAPLDDEKNYPMGINLAFLFTRDYLELGKAMLGTRSSDILFNHFTAICAHKIMEYNKARLSKIKDPDALLYKAEAAAAGVVRMLFKWLEEGATTPEDKIIGFAKQFLAVV